MLKNAVQCDKCNTIKYCDSYSDALKLEGTKGCCEDSKYVFIGLQVYKKSILNITGLDEDSTSDDIFEVSSEHREMEDGKYGETVFTPVKIELSDLIDSGKRMSGKYMAEVIRDILEHDDNVIQKLRVLKNAYTDYFDYAMKLVPKFLKNKYGL